MSDPLYFFRSRSGRKFLSFVEPPADFPLAGSVERGTSVKSADPMRGIPNVGWTHGAPAILYRRGGTGEFFVAYPDEPAPDGFDALGSDFAFVLDDEVMAEAMRADVGPETS